MIRGIAPSILAGLMLQGGCVAADDSHIDANRIPVYIDRPVACVEDKDIWPKPAPRGARPADSRQGEAVLLSKVIEWEQYGDHNDPKLRACAKKP